MLLLIPFSIGMATTLRIGQTTFHAALIALETFSKACCIVGRFRSIQALMVPRCLEKTAAMPAMIGSKVLLILSQFL